MAEPIEEKDEFVEKDPNLPNSLEEARQRGYETFHESPGLTPHLDNFVFSTRVKRKIRKYLECTADSDGRPCGETLPYNSPDYTVPIKNVYVCTDGRCTTNGYIVPIAPK